MTRTWTSATSAFAVLTLSFSSPGLPFGRAKAKPAAAIASPSAPIQSHLRTRFPFDLAMGLPLAAPPGDPVKCPTAFDR